MIPVFGGSGNLPPGIHHATWDEVSTRFGGSPHRERLLDGLLLALLELAVAGCRTVFLDGSFVTAKNTPADFDACWDPVGVDPYLLDPTLLDFQAGRSAQKAKYRGELFPSTSSATLSGTPFLRFFQTDRLTGDEKGVVAIDPQTLAAPRGGVP